MKILKSLLLIAAAVSVFHAVPAAAQGDSPYETGILQARIDSLTHRLDKMEKKSTRWEKLLANLPQITGYGLLGFEWDSAAEASSTTFNIKSVRLILAGDISRRFDYKFQFEFVSPKLIDAYVRYKLHPAFNLQAGQFRTSFSLEGYMVPLEMEAIDFAPVVKAICTQYCDTRDIGIAAYGGFINHKDGFQIIEYFAGVYNGEGKNKSDANHSKDFIGRLKVNPHRYLTLSGSFSYGEQGTDYIHNTRYAAGFWWHGERFFLRSEYQCLRQNDWKAGEKRQIEGCYATVGYRFGKLCPVARFNYMESTMSGAPVKQSDYMAGLDYRPLKYLRLQANYTRTQYRGAGGSNLVGIVLSGIF